MCAVQEICDRTALATGKGLGELVTAFTTVRAEGGQVKLLKLTHRIRDLLQITNLLTVFHAFENETEAIKSMR